MTAAKKQKTEAERLAELGQDAYSAILWMVERLRVAREAEVDVSAPREGELELESAERAIQEDALSVQVRSGWYTPGERDADTTPAEYELLLGTGGPAVRIVGKLDAHCEPTSARLETQDWGTPWTKYHGIEITRGPRRGERKDLPDEGVLLDYARCFYFGEG